MYVSRFARYAALLFILPFEYCKDITTDTKDNPMLPGQILRIACFSFVLPFGSNAQKLPVDIKDLALYVESSHIDTALHVSHCSTEPCRTEPNTESAPIKDQYCDTDKCPHGCVRRWLDESSYIPVSGFKPPEYTKGRNFGQDDNEKPCYIPNAINGKPSIKGGAPYGVFKQDKYLELAVPDIIGLANDFSIYLLCKPIDQSATGDWYYFGQASTFLKHKTSDNSLRLRVSSSAAELKLTNSNTIAMDKWQLIEIHRDVANEIHCLINGIDQTAGTVIQAGTFRIGYLLSNYKTNGKVAMYGEVASFFIYNRMLADEERGNVLTYIHDEYLEELPLAVNTRMVAKREFDVFYNSEEKSIVIIAATMDVSTINKVNIIGIDGHVLAGFTPNKSAGKSTISFPFEPGSPQIVIVRIETDKGVMTRKVYLKTQ